MTVSAQDVSVVAAVVSTVAGPDTLGVGLMKCDHRLGGVDDGDVVERSSGDEEVVVARPPDHQVWHLQQQQPSSSFASYITNRLVTTCDQRPHGFPDCHELRAEVDCIDLQLTSVSLQLIETIFSRPQHHSRLTEHRRPLPNAS